VFTPAHRGLPPSVPCGKVVVLRGALSSQNTPFATLMQRSTGTLTTTVRRASPQVNRAPRTYRPNRRLTRAERTQLAEQYNLGMSALELARKYGINRHTVAKHLKRDGVVVRGGQTKMTPDTISKAAQLYATGLSLFEVGAHLGVDTTTVHKALKKAGVKDARYSRAADLVLQP
jgi:DNA-binding CsgD family transcriptional regulator